MVNGFACAMIDVERNAQRLETIAHLNMILINNGSWCCVFFKRLIGDRCTVLVAAGYKQDVLTQGAKVTDVNIGRDICARQMPDVLRTVGVRQCGGNRISLELFHKASLRTERKDDNRNGGKKIPNGPDRQVNKCSFTR